MQVANDGISSFGDDVGFLVGVDGKDVLRRHCTYPVLDGSRNAARDVNVWSNSSTRLTNLVGVVTPAVIGHCARATHNSAK